MEVEVAVVEDLGSDAHAIFTIDAPPPELDGLRGARADDDGAVLLAGQGTVFTARVGLRSAAAPGRALELAVDPAAFHFFDPAIGASLARRTRAVETADA
jgi:hypothetical protein